MKNILIALGLLGSAFVFAQAPAPAAASAAAAQPSDQTSVAYMQAAQMGKIAAEGAPGNGRYFPPVPADPKLPTLWIIGDSTVRNGTAGNGGTNAPDGQWGWGAPLTYYFDVSKVNVVNRAFGGTTARSFYEGFFWKNMQPQIKKGDFVILQFGANTGELPGLGDDVQNNQHTFGWYIEQFVKETREKGGTPIICSLTPRKKWMDGKQSEINSHVDWAAQAAKDINAPYIDLHELIQRKYTELGPDKVDLLYVPTPAEAADNAAKGLTTNNKPEALHTGWAGAVVNAECVVSGLKELKDQPLAALLNSRAKAIKSAPAECVADNPASAKTDEAKPAAATAAK